MRQFLEQSLPVGTFPLVTFVYTLSIILLCLFGFFGFGVQFVGNHEPLLVDAQTKYFATSQLSMFSAYVIVTSCMLFEKKTFKLILSWGTAFRLGNAFKKLNC